MRVYHRGFYYGVSTVRQTPKTITVNTPFEDSNYFGQGAFSFPGGNLTFTKRTNGLWVLRGMHRGRTPRLLI